MKCENNTVIKRESLFSIFLLDIVCCLVLTVYCLLSSAYGETPSPYAGDSLVNSQAPEFTLKDVDGKAVSLASYKGTVVLLNFWATWCPSCRDEMPAMTKLSQQFKNRKFSIIAVSTDRSFSYVRDFLKKHPADFTVLVDDELAVSRSLYKVFVLPMSFLIDKKGMIVERYYGGENWTDPEIARRIDGLMSK